MFDKVGIIGLGLIGGSIAKAFKNRLGVKTIVAMNRNEDVLKAAYAEGVIDAYTTTVNEIFKRCDIVFICTPVKSIFKYAMELKKYIDKDCIVSDVGSTKSEIFDAVMPFKNNFLFIGGHPMTGSEKFRYNASKEHLFENAYYILTPADNVPKGKVTLLKNSIEQIGAIPIVISPYSHDYIVASVSHVPHLIASALCQSVKELDTKENHMKLLAAGGFKDITRIASSSPEMWENICLSNRKEIVKVLAHFEKIIGDVKESIINNDSAQVFDYFKDAKDYRDSFTALTPGAYAKRYDINVDILDKPGSIAIITVLLSSHGINIKNFSIVNSREQDAGVLQLSFDSEAHRQKSAQLLEEMNFEVTIKK